MDNKYKWAKKDLTLLFCFDRLQDSVELGIAAVSSFLQLDLHCEKLEKLQNLRHSIQPKTFGGRSFRNVGNPRTKHRRRPLSASVDQKRLSCIRSMHILCWHITAIAKDVLSAVHLILQSERRDADVCQCELQIFSTKIIHHFKTNSSSLRWRQILKGCERWRGAECYDVGP